MDSTPAPANTDTDLDLQERVRDAIYALDVMRGTRAHVNVTVAKGHVTLDGVVQSPMAAAEVERAAADVAGAGAVTSHLLDDATLSSRVAEALGKDPRTATIPPGYDVVSVFGHMWIVGSFTPEQAQAVTAVARSVPGVLTITIKEI
jgi:osmotically-inducible protein OsmY